ncbi:MAG: hypothetical protein WCS31_13585 [Verrucomicrobiae bacterium]
MGQDPQVSADKLSTTIEEPLSDNGLVKLFLAVERIPGLDKKGDLLKQLDADLTAPDQPEGKLAPVGGDKLVAGGNTERWLPVRLEYGGYEFQSSPAKSGGYLEYSTNYAFCQLVSPAACKAILSFGNDDSYKIYLNGKLLARKVYQRGALEDSDQIPIELRAGRNDLLIRIDNYGSSAALIFKVLGEDRKPLPGLRVQIETLPNVPEIRPDRIPAIPAEDETFFGARIPRTMSLLESSGPKRRTPVKILLYGQSITAQDQWARIIRTELSKRYPYAKIEMENLSIGGHIAPQLAFSAINDLYPSYPDLIIFQVYFGERDGSLERIFSNIRRRTTAEIITWTEHLDNFDRDALMEDSAAYRRMMAAKYGIEIVEVRELWKKFLQTHALSRRDVLADGIHPNYLGGSLLGHLVLRHFRFNENAPSFWTSTVRTYEAAKPLVDKDSEISLVGNWRLLEDGIEAGKTTDSLKMAFTGNRVDLVVPAVTSKEKWGSAKILIDGKSPSQFPECYASTRARCDFAPDSRPGFRYVKLGPDPVAENWILKISNLSDDLKTFDYEFVGSKTGSDGNGSAKVSGNIISKSGKVSACGGFNFHEIAGFAKATLGSMPKEFTIGWKVYLTGSDTYAPRCDLPAGEIETHTVAQGLSNASHVLEIISNGDGPLPLKEIVVHSPPLK